MNIHNFINELIVELAYRTDSGIPDLKNKKHLDLLSEILLEWGLGELETPLLDMLTEAESPEDKNYSHKAYGYYVKKGDEDRDDAQIYRKDGEGKTATYIPVNKDEYDEKAKEQGEMGDKSTSSGGTTPQPTDGGGEGEVERGTALNPNTEAGKEYTENLPEDDPARTNKEVYPVGGGYYSDTPDGDPKYKRVDELNEDTITVDTPNEDDVEMELIDTDTAKKVKNDLKSTEFKKLHPSTIKTKKLQLSDARRRIERSDSDENVHTLFKIFETNMNNILSASTDAERIDAIRTLADYNILQRNGNGQKIYISNLPLPSKQMTGQSGDSFGKLITKLAEDNQIDIPLRDSSADRALADISGKHNEAGVVAILNPSTENVNQYNELRDMYMSYGGDEGKAHTQNEGAAESIKSEIESKYPGGKIRKAIQVGGVGESELNKLGINPKKDPTDIIIEIETPNGTIETMKISMKVYSDPRSITMKNSGIGSAGSHYLGFDEIDNEWGDMRARNNWVEDGISPEEVEKRKRLFREEYLTKFSNKMLELSESVEGQKKLMDMWQEVHGCGNEVFTSITNKNTGDTNVYPPEYYCNPETPFKVEYDGVKVVIRMGKEGANSFLELVCKTEQSGASKLLFNHKKRKF